LTDQHRSTATLGTSKASRYLQTMCKHFSHKIKTEFTPDRGQIEFPFGNCELTATGSALDLEVSATTVADLKKLQNVVGSHLERFAFREKLIVTWK